MNKKEFGLNLAKLREKTGLSAYELSMRLGKDSTYINKIENGLSLLMKNKKISRLGDFLVSSFYALVGYNGKSNTPAQTSCE